MISADTQPNIAKKQIDTLKKMTTSQRAEMTFQLSDNLRDIVQEGIRQRHPEYTQDQVVQAALSLIMDKDMVKQAFEGREVSA